MLKYCGNEEAGAISQAIIQEGVVVARRVEKQQPPQPTQTEDEIQEYPIFAKKRRLVDILTITNFSHGEIFSHQECFQDELFHFSSTINLILDLNGENSTGKFFFIFQY